MASISIGKAGLLPAGQMAEFQIGALPIVVCNVNGHLFAVDGRCPHQGAPMAQGALHGHTVVCPWHGWEFDCTTGRGEFADLETYRIEVVDGMICLNA